MVPFTPQIAAVIIAFAVVTDATSVTYPVRRQPVLGPILDSSSVGHEKRMVKVRTPSSGGEATTKSFSMRSDHSSAIGDNSRMFLKVRSGPGPSRLNTDNLDRRSQHGKHGRHGHKKHHRHQSDNLEQKAVNQKSPGASNATTSTGILSRSDAYMTKGSGNHRISIKPVTYYLSETEHTHALASRGFLDPIIPLVGLIPGLEGIVKLFPELLNGVLGPALGGLIISPSKQTNQTSAMDNDSNSLANKSSYILAAAQGNTSTIWLVDTGRPAPPDTESISDSNSTIAAKSERMVSLQMAFVDSKTGNFEAYCATYERDPAKPVSLGVVPCNDKNPKESQMFAYDPETSILRAIWDSDPGASMGMRRRQYMVGNGMNMTADAAGSMVVMVFQAANTTTQSAKSNTSDLLGTPGNTPSAAMSNPSSLPESSPTSPNNTVSSSSRPSSDDEEDDDSSDALEATKPTDSEPTTTLVPEQNAQPEQLEALADSDSSESNARSEAIASSNADTTPLFVEHVGSHALSEESPSVD